MDNKITPNLVYLAYNLTNLDTILLYLQENDVFSLNECDETRNENTPFNQNVKLLNILQRKDFPINLFLEILRNTQNGHCADQIERISPGAARKLEKPKILENVWWPEKKVLIKSLQRRKIGNKLLVEVLHERVSSDEKRMLVICESLDASKLTALGGVGKTLTATWYGLQYEGEYDHVIWIDCGEDSLLKSFESLARDLDISKRDELSTVEEFSIKCYEALKEFKCLFIFDNAESYKGEEGIKEVLPKFKENFYCVITSRSLDWGTQNVGYGKISRLELSIFGETESLEFLKTYLNEEIQHTEHQLKELSNLLGYLPLATQLAVAALNMGEIDLQNYIEETSSKDVGNIVDTKFDDYERTINRNIKISLDLIEKEKNGKSVNDILMILGYIRPDNIQSKFLMKIMKIELNILKGAIDLLEKYSLVSKSGTVQETPYDEGIKNKILRRSRIKTEMDMLSIHRLLQQVIRHNCRESENETLRKILGCNGFLDYKLLPFTKYASDELRKEFPKVKAQLLDQQQLKKLVNEKRFEESVQLAKFIDKELNTATTMFNYAICLGENGLLKEAEEVLTSLFRKHKIEKKDVTIAAKILLGFKKSSRKVVAYGNIVDIGTEPTTDQISYLRFHLYFRLGRIEDDLKENAFGLLQTLQIVSLKDILKYVVQEERFGESVLLSRYIDQEINTNVSKFNYAICLEKNQQLGDNIMVLEQLYKQEMNEAMHYYDYTLEMGLLKLESEVTKSLVGGHLLVSLWTMDNNNERLKEILEERKSFVMIPSKEMITPLVRILYSNLIHSNYTLKNKGQMLKLVLGGDDKSVELKYCSVDLSRPLLRGLSEMQKSLSEGVHFTDGNPKDTKSEVSQEIPKILNTIKVYCYMSKVSLESVSSIENISMSNCSLSLDSVIRIFPTELKLHNATFVKNGEKLSNVKVNEFIDFSKMKRLKLFYYETNVSIDLSEESANIEYLLLWKVNVLSLKSADGNGRVNIKEAIIEEGRSLDLSILPPSLEKLTLSGPSKVFVSGAIELPNLKYLHFDGGKNSDLSPFRSTQLTHLYLRKMKEVNVDLLPQNILIIRIDKMKSGIKLQGGVIPLNKLILAGFPLNEVEEMLTHFHLKELVLYSGFAKSYKPVDLIQCTDKRIPTIAMGKVDWEGNYFKNSNFSKQVDRQSEYYLFHEGAGKAINKKDFEEMYLLKHIFEP